MFSPCSDDIAEHRAKKSDHRADAPDSNVSEVSVMTELVHLSLYVHCVPEKCKKKKLAVTWPKLIWSPNVFHTRKHMKFATKPI